jgi:DNA-binding PucR family transcriptional regulator
VARHAAAEAGGVDPDLLGEFLDRLAEPGPGHDWNRQATATFAALGARAARQGVALRALVDLYLSAAWRAWPRLPAVASDEADAVRAAGQRVLRTCDDAVAALAEGYGAARQEAVRAAESARREFVDDLLAGTADPGSLLERAEAYGLALTGAHRALLATGASPFHEASPLASEISTALGTRDALVTTRDGSLVIALPAASPPLETALTAVRRALRAGGREEGARLAIGRAHPGPSGVARSLAEARDAMSLAATLRLSADTVRAEDLLVYQVLLRDRTALAELIETVLTPLQRARGGARPLLATLHAYLDSGGNTTATARALHLSVRAVGYRLQRVTELTGLHPDRPGDRYTLHTAVLGARALDWPDTTTDPAEPEQ